MQKLVWQNSNGDTVDLTKAPYGITEWEGFSNASLNIQSQQVPFQDGDVFLDALIEQRELSVTLAMQDNNNLEERYRMRRELIHVLNPKLGEGYLIYTNDFISKRIKCVAQIPLFETHNSNDSGTPKASLAWTACEPYWEDLEDTSEIIEFNKAPIIYNEGDVSASVKIQLTPRENVVNPIIKNTNTGKQIGIKGTVFSNTVININTNSGKKTVTLGNYFQDITEMKYGIGNQVLYSEKRALFYYVLGKVIFTSQNGTDIKLLSSKVTDKLLYSEKYDVFLVISNRVVYSTKDFKNYTTVTNVGLGEGIGCIVEDSNTLYYISVSKTVKTNNGEIWESVQNNISANNIKNVTHCIFDGSKFVATLNTNNEDIIGVITSTDCETWENTVDIAETKGYCTKIIYKDNVYYVLKTSVSLDHNVVVKSEDLINWESYATGILGNRDFEYSNLLRLFVVIGERYYKYSYDCETFTTAYDIGYDKILLSVTVSNTFGFLACGSTSNSTFTERRFLVLMSENGTDVKKMIDKTVNPINGFAYSNEKDVYILVKTFVEFPSSVYISKNGIDGWQEVNIGEMNIKKCICADEMFVMLGKKLNKYYVLKSIDGINWDTILVPYDNIRIDDLIFDTERFILIGQQILISADLTNWEQIETVEDFYVSKLTYNNKGVYVGIGGNQIYTSTNLTDWENHSLGETFNYDVIYAEAFDLFIVIKSTYSAPDYMTYTEYYSKDGYNWTEKYLFHLPFHIANNSICNSKYFNGVVLLNQLSKITYDGINWADFNDINGNTLYDCKYNTFVNKGSQLFYIGYKESENIINKLTQDSDMSFDLQIGTNQIKLLQESGSFYCNVSYRQKYIGV